MADVTILDESGQNVKYHDNGDGSFSPTSYVTNESAGGSSVVNGQATMANSAPMVIASDQSAVKIITDGAAATGLTQDTGGTGPLGWMSSVVKNLRLLVSGITVSSLPAITGTVTANAGTGFPSANANGQATMANSAPVAIASNQSAVPVSGTVTANAGTGFPSANANGQATSANSAPVVLASDQSALPIIGYKPSAVTGTLTTTSGAGSTVSASCAQAGSAAISINGTYTNVALVFEASDDGGTTWYTVVAHRSDSITTGNGYNPASSTAQNLYSASLLFRVAVATYTTVRVRCNNYGSGTVNVRITLSAMPFETPFSVYGLASGNPIFVQAASTIAVSTQGNTIFVTPTVTASSAYAAGNCVGTVMTFSGMARSGILSSVIQSIIIQCKSVQTTAFKLYILNGSLNNGSTKTDKGAPSIVTADMYQVLGVYTLSANDSGLGTFTIYNLDNIGKQFYGATQIFALLVCVGTPTFASTTDVTVGIGVLQN
jgi:hypothetical protein